MPKVWQQRTVAFGEVHRHFSCIARKSRYYWTVALVRRKSSYPHQKRDTFFIKLIVLGARLVRNGGGHVEKQVLIQGCRHTDGLRKHGGGAGTRHAVQAFVPPVVGRYTQTFNGGVSYFICASFSANVIWATSAFAGSSKVMTITSLSLHHIPQHI